jgi:hypothetical protein
MSGSRAFAVIFAVGVLTGCSASHKSAETAPTPEKQTLLSVDNRAFLDMTVYVLNGPQRVRLGIAGGKTVTELTIPAFLVRVPKPLRFLADPIGGGRTPLSEEIMVEPGDEVSLTIPS